MERIQGLELLPQTQLHHRAELERIEMNYILAVGHMGERLGAAAWTTLTRHIKNRRADPDNGHVGMYPADWGRRVFQQELFLQAARAFAATGLPRTLPDSSRNRFVGVCYLVQPGVEVVAHTTQTLNAPRGPSEPLRQTWYGYERFLDTFGAPRPPPRGSLFGELSARVLAPRHVEAAPIITTNLGPGFTRNEQSTAQDSRAPLIDRAFTPLGSGTVRVPPSDANRDRTTLLDLYFTQQSTTDQPDNAAPQPSPSDEERRRRPHRPNRRGGSKVQAKRDRARERQAAGSTSTDADTEAEQPDSPEPEPDLEPLPDFQNLCCPISHELLRDPVRISGSGSVYAFEREAIEEWFSHKHTDPMSNQQLSEEQRRLESDHDLAALVLRYRMENGLPLVGPASS
jgi:hypothetical protein